MNKPIAFGFKNKKVSVLKPPLIPQVKDNGRDFITSIEEKTIQSTRYFHKTFIEKIY